MFETSSILSMLGMAQQVKGAGMNAVQGIPSAMQTDAGAVGQAPPSLGQNSSLFQLILSFALPQADAKSALPDAGKKTGRDAGESIPVPFTRDENEIQIEGQSVTATALVPFYPVLWAAVPVTQPAVSTDAAASTDATAGIQAPATVESARAAAIGGLSTASPLEIAAPNQASAQAGQAVAVNGPMVNAGAVLAQGTPQSEEIARDGITAAVAAMQRVPAASASAAEEIQNAMKSTVAVQAARTEAAAASPIASTSDAGPAGNIAEAAGRMPLVQNAGDGRASASAPEAVAAEPKTVTDVKSEMTMNESSAARAAGTESGVLQAPTDTAGRSTGRTAAEPAPAASAIRTTATVQAETTISKMAASQQAKVSTVHEKRETPVAAVVSGGAAAAQTFTLQGAPQKIVDASPSAAAVSAPDVRDLAEQAPAQVQQKISMAPEAQGKLHETVIAALQPDAVKSAIKAAVGAPVSLRTQAEETAPSGVQTSSEKISAPPATDAAAHAALQSAAVQTPSREQSAALPRTEGAPDARTVKTDVPTQQPLANVADVQRQFVPLHETAAPAAPAHVHEEVFEKIYKEVSSIKHTPTSVDVTLSPESMGRVTIKVGLEEGKMAARIDVQNVEVKHIIESNMPRLQDALQSNGIVLDAVAVFVNNGSTFADKRNDAPKKKSNNGSVKIEDGFEPLSSLRDSKQYGYNTVEYIM